MRLLCDQNVARRYVKACIQASDLRAVTVRDALDPRATDSISRRTLVKTGTWC